MASIPPLFAERARRLSEMSRGERARARRELAQLFGVSPATVSRWCRALGIEERRRSGKRRAPVTDAQLQELFKLQFSSHKLQQGPLMTAKDVIEIGERNGIIEPGALSPSAYNAWLRAHGMARAEVDAPEPHVELVSKGPQHVHQADFSLAINWKVENNKPIYEALVYKNKLSAEGVPRIWRFLLTDHSSGMLFAWYGVAPGENLELLLEGLFRAWTEKRHKGRPIPDLFPFRGVPRILMMDRGPGVKSGVLSRMLERLGVRLIECQGARAKGSVETTHWWWECRFESRFRLQPPASIEELNDHAIEFAARLNATEIHRRHRATRRAHWEFHVNRSFETQLRVPNCTVEELKRIAVSEPRRARVNGAGVISFRGERYRVPGDLLGTRYVAVQYSPFEFPAVTVRAWGDAQAPAYLCRPIEVDEHGFPVDGAVIGEEFHGQKYTERKRAVEDAKRAVNDYVGRIQTRGYHLEGLTPSGIRPRSEEIDVGAAEERRLTAMAARIAVREALGRPLTRAESDYLAGVFGEQVTEAELSAAIEAIQQGIQARVLEFPAGRGS